MVKTLRETWQKKKVLDHLMSRFDHPSVEMVWRDVNVGQTRKMSLATVYRVLKRLKEEGQIKEWRFNHDESSRFEPNIKKHWHFICQDCGLIQDVMNCPIPQFNKVTKTMHGLVHDYRLDFYGKCLNCLNK